jgi:hypothetical protein
MNLLKITSLETIDSRSSLSFSGGFRMLNAVRAAEVAIRLSENGWPKNRELLKKDWNTLSKELTLDFVAQAKEEIAHAKATEVRRLSQ